MNTVYAARAEQSVQWIPLLPLCDCDDGNVYRVLKAKTSGSKKKGVYLCRACGRCNPHGIVWRFLVGAEAAASVLATALYQNLKPGEEKEKIEIGSPAA